MKTQNCAYCNQPFTFQRPRLCCNRSCAAKYKMLKEGKTPWTEPELDLLDSLAGCFPRHEITAAYNKRATRQGFVVRSENAVLVKLKRIGQSLKTIEDNWQMSTLAGLLDVNRDRVRTWVHGSSRDGIRKGGKLRHRKVGNMTIISKHDFLMFARQFPEKLKGIHPSNLLSVLDDQDLVYQIINLGKPTTGRKHKIIRVETGEVFQSARQAGKALHGDSKHILKQLKQGKKAYGMEFKVVAIQGGFDYSHMADDFMPDSVLKERIAQMTAQNFAKADIARRLNVSVRKVEYVVSSSQRKP